MRADPAMQGAILDAGAREFAEHGYAAASLNRILLAAGLSKGSFYYYFDDKADLAAAVLEREVRRWDLAELRVVDSADEFWTEIDRFVSRSLEQLREAPDRADLLSRLGTAVARDPVLLERCGPVIAASQQHAMAFWRRGQELGAVRTDLSIPALMAIAQATKTALVSQLLPGDRGATADELDAFTHLYCDLLHRMCAPRELEVKP